MPGVLTSDYALLHRCLIFGNRAQVSPVENTFTGKENETCRKNHRSSAYDDIAQG
jgi:hypothetical protein